MQGVSSINLTLRRTRTQRNSKPRQVRAWLTFGAEVASFVGCKFSALDDQFALLERNLSIARELIVQLGRALVKTGRKINI